MDVSIGAEARQVASSGALSDLLIELDHNASFEFWIYAPAGPSMCLLRSGPRAWLMYLRFEGDSGFTSIGEDQTTDMAQFTLSNGQVDEYPMAWCIQLPLALKAIQQFFATDGAQPAVIAWAET
jgi:hypothetical protein